MPDKLAVIQSEQTIKELSLIDDRIKGLVSSFNGLVDVSAKVSSGLIKGTPKEFLDAEKQMVVIQKQKAQVLKELAIAEKQLSAININNERARQAKANADKAEIALTQKKIQLSKQEEKEQQRLVAAISLYKKVEQGLNSLRARYNELAIKKEFGIQLSVREEQRMASLQKAMTKYDNALKAVDATGGKYNRNVGNYASGFNAMNNSVAQLTREMPAFANSVQTGFMALSNNIPIFFDAVNQAVDKNKQLTAEGKKGVPVWKQLAGALFSFSTLLSVGVVLLTVYGKDIVEWGMKMIKGAESINQVKEAQQNLNEAVKSTEFKKAVRDVSEMTNTFELAREGVISKEKALKFYNDTLGKVMGSAKNLNEAEMILTKNADNYIKATLYKAAANLALDKSAGEMLKAEEARQKKLVDFDNKFNDATITQIRSKEQFDAEERRIANARKKRQQEEIKAAEDNARVQENIAKNMMKTAAGFSKGMNFDSLIGKDSPKPKANKISTSSLSKKQIDYLASLAAIRDNEIANQRERQLKGKTNEKQYWEEYIKIITNYKTKIEAYLTGANGRQRAIEASVRRRGIEEIVKVNKEIYDYEKKAMDAQKKLQDQNLENKLESIKNNEYILEQERIKQQSTVYDELIVNTDKYYFDLIEKAKKYGQEIINIEAERDTKIADLQKYQMGVNSGSSNAFNKDVAYYQQIEDAYRSAANADQRRLIIENSRFTIKQKEYFLSLKEKEQGLEILQNDKKRLSDRENELRLKADSNKLTISESTELSNIVDKMSLLNEKLALTDEQIKQIKLDKLRDDWSTTVDFISNGLKDLGFTNFADAFQDKFAKIMQDLKDGTLDWKDVTLLAASAVADGLTMLNESSYQQRVSQLDEELKRTQEVTEQEIGFIDSRLERLNSLDELSKEQIAERNALEDEARVLKEQQFQREKQIAAQKAKAQQRAAAQQALINGFLAATKTLAELGIPIGIAPAAVALGFGVLQAGLIMSKNPVPEYFVGRKGGEAEWAITQDRYGAEAISDKKGNIKTWGSDKGGQLTWLEKGDNVHTAKETKKMLSEIDNMPKLGSNVFNKIASQNITPILIQKENIDYDKLAGKVGNEFRRGLKYFDKPTVTTDIRGNKYLHEGGKIPVFLGREKKKTIIIKSGNNERN